MVRCDMCASKRRSDNMKRALSPVVVVADAQPRRSGFLNDPPAQRFDLRRLALARRVVAPLTGAGHRLKRPANKLDRALHAGAILLRPAQPGATHKTTKVLFPGKF